MSRWAKLAALGLVTVACLGWALWGMDFRAFGAALQGFNLVWALGVIAGSTLIVIARVFRFSALLEQKVPMADIVSVMQVGFLAINVIPLRMGEFVRPYLLAEEHGVPFGAAMAAVVMERLLDMTALLVLLLIVGTWVEIPGGGITVSGVDLLVAGQRAMATSVGVGVVGIIALVFAGPPGLVWMNAILSRISPSLAPRLIGLLEKLVGGFRSMGSRPVAALQAVVATAVGWVATIASCWAVMKGFAGLEPSMGMLLANWAATITAMTLLPTPGFVGSWEAGSVGSLLVYGVEPDLARAYSVLSHALMTSYTLLTGLAFLLWKGRSLGELVRASRNAA